MNLWQCPRPARFLKDVCDALKTLQNHCIVSMPARLIPSFQEELTARWQDTRGSLALLPLDGGLALVDAMAPLFLTGCEDDEAITLGKLMEGTLRGSDTLAVVLPDAPSPVENELFRFLKDDLAAHAKNCRDNATGMLWNMLVLAPADRDVPAADIGLKSFCWWGRLHNSDLEYAIEATFQDFAQGEGQDRLAFWWLYPLCRSLAVTDPGLVELIHRSPPVDVDELMALLTDHELDTEENGRLVGKFLEEECMMPVRGERPQGLTATLWQRGIVDLNCEGTLSVHPAALLAAGCRNEIEQIVTRGQMQFFLPLVQEVHGLLVRQVEETLGCALEERLPPEGSLPPPHVDLQSALFEIGPLTRLIDWLAEEGETFPQHIVPAARAWRDLRNRITHFSMLPLGVVKTALEHYEKLLAADRRPD